MSVHGLVVACALELLGRSVTQLPPIKVLESPPPVVSPNSQAFVDGGEGVIYLIASAPAFREAESMLRASSDREQSRPRTALKMVASVIVHEEWHVKHGGDEKGAYQAQLTALNWLGLGAGTLASSDVRRSMQAVISAQSRSTRRPAKKTLPSSDVD